LEVTALSLALWNSRSISRVAVLSLELSERSSSVGRPMAISVPATATIMSNSISENPRCDREIVNIALYG
jgi:hypothetical protein